MEQSCQCGAWQCDDCRPETSPFGDPLCGVCRQAWTAPGTEGQVCFVQRLVAAQKPPLGPPLVERELRCCTCRRLYCRVLAAADVTIVTLCEGCQREGR